MPPSNQRAAVPNDRCRAGTRICEEHAGPKRPQFWKFAVMKREVFGSTQPTKR